MHKRLTYLDSMRGIAAFSVVILHIIEAHWGYLTSAKIALIVFNGTDAVSFFFVLSGLVLSKKYMDKPELLDSLNYRSYVIKRIFRLYPVFLMVLFMMYGYLHRWDLKNGIVFFKDLFTNKHHLIEQILLVRGWLDKILIPAWTLAIELVMSFLIPMLLIVLQKNKKLFYFLIPLVFYANKFYISIFLFHFLLGIILADNFKKIEEDRSSKFYRNRKLILLMSVVLYSWRRIMEFITLPKFIQNISDNILFLDYFFITGLGSFGILWFIINSPRAQNILNIKPLIWLGEISYCVYLTHYLFTTVFMDKYDKIAFKLGEENMFIAMLFFVLTGTFILSALMNKYIEKPFIKFGKKA